ALPIYPIFGAERTVGVTPDDTGVVHLQDCASGPVSCDVVEGENGLEVRLVAPTAVFKYGVVSLDGPLPKDCIGNGSSTRQLQLGTEPPLNHLHLGLKRRLRRQSRD